MKQKKLILALVLMTTVVLFEVYGQNYSAPKIGQYSYIDYLERDVYHYIFEENNKIFYHKNGTELKSGTYIMDESSGVPFINIQWGNNTTERFLMLIDDDFLCFYDSDNLPVFFGYYSELS